MDKPQSLSVKDYLVRTLAVKLMVSEKVIDTVVSHQFSEANSALKLHDSIEISGFGKFFFNHKKAVKKLEKMYGQKESLERIIDSPNASDQRKNSAQMKLTSLLMAIEHLKSKLDA